MSLAIAILGATGVYGRALVPRLTARGHRVRAMVRNPASAPVLTACGAEIARADIFDAESLRAGFSGCDVVVNLATALRDTGAGSDYALNDRVRREGVPILLQAAADSGVARVLQQSIAMAHGDGQNWADEDTIGKLNGDPVSDAAYEAARAVEAAVQASSADWIILCGGLFYGPGTGFDAGWRDRARAGKLRLPGDGSDYVSLLHVADMAAASVQAIELWPSRRLLMITDDAPAPWSDVMGYIAASENAPPPTPGGRLGFPSFRIANRRAREALQWAPFYRDFRVGLAQ
jgi:nucleoside-diphosphate-sugar epimerase